MRCHLLGPETNPDPAPRRWPSESSNLGLLGFPPFLTVCTHFSETAKTRRGRPYSEANATRRRLAIRQPPNHGCSVRSTTVGTKPLLSVSEAALLLGMDRSTLYRAIRQGEAGDIPMARVGRRMRIPRRAIERLVAGKIGWDEGGTIDQDPGRCPACGSSLTLSPGSADRDAPIVESLRQGARHGKSSPCSRQERQAII